MPQKDPPVWRRIAWFAGLWIASVAALAVVAAIIKTVLN
ncbi:MAG TPA: DUF2474 family protein [Allosphingosinicella sp.]|jgi:hypothetical protein|nr:DUF2474 family protein [Allosphingosinicella sp.]